MSGFVRTTYHSKLVGGHNFLVFFGSLIVSFAKISGLSNELHMDAMQEGGVNDAMVLLAGPRKKLGTVIFEHGVGMLNPLNQQFEMTNDFGVIFSFPTTILIFDNGGSLIRAVGYNGGVPVKWSVSDLNAQSGEIFMDRIEVMHQGLFPVPI